MIILRVMVYGGVVDTIDTVSDLFNFQQLANVMESGEDNDLYKVVIDPNTQQVVNWEHVPSDDVREEIEGGYR